MRALLGPPHLQLCAGAPRGGGGSQAMGRCSALWNSAATSHGSQETSGSAVALATSLHQKGHIYTGQVHARLWITPQSGDEAKISPRQEGRGDIYFKPIPPAVAQSLTPNGEPCSAVSRTIKVGSASERERVRPPAWRSCHEGAESADEAACRSEGSLS